MKKNIICVIKNVIICLFFFLVGVIVGGYYFYALGTVNINHRLIVSAFNNGYVTGCGQYVNEKIEKIEKIIEKILEEKKIE